MTFSLKMVMISLKSEKFLFPSPHCNFPIVKCVLYTHNFRLNLYHSLMQLKAVPILININKYYLLVNLTTISMLIPLEHFVPIVNGWTIRTAIWIFPSCPTVVVIFDVFPNQSLKQELSSHTVSEYLQISVQRWKIVCFKSSTPAS